MGTYDEARGNEFTAAATKTIAGVPLEVAEDSALISGIGRIPIQWCVDECYAEPCDCHGPIIWIEEADVRQRVATERKTRSDEQLYEFKIDLDATVLIESVVRAKAGDLSRRQRLQDLNPSKHLPTKAGCGCHGPFETIRADVSGVYVGSECAGHTQYEVYEDHRGLATTFHYLAVGSC